MFKQKPIYVILLIIFTLLLCADIVGYILAANTETNSMPSSWDGTQMQSGMGERPDMSSDGSDTAGTADSSADTTDSSTSTSDRPSFGGDMPGGGEMPENFDPTQMQNGSGRLARWRQTNTDSSESGLINFITGWWIPIGIVCVLMDLFCVWMLRRISKRGAAETESAEDAAAETELMLKTPKLSSYEKRRRKRRRTIKVLTAFGAVLLSIILVYVIIRSSYLAQVAQAQAASVVSTQAVSTDIDKVISGTGTLTDSDAVEVSILDGVEIESYHVENGDTVAEGDVLATVDHTSLMVAIQDLQNAMDDLDDQIDAASSDEISDTIKASVDGRVKAVYAKENESVVDTMYSSGALMLISLDGLMAVDVTTDADIATGDAVTVTLSDGTEISGRVAGYVGGVAKITVTDKGTTYGDTVSVTDANGTALGDGTLYIDSELKVTGYSGTVAAVKYDAEDEVSAGDTLLTLTDTGCTAEYELLLAQREKYEEEMLKLFKLYQDGNIYAEYAGVISGLDETDSEAATDTQTADTAEAAVDTNAAQTADTLAYITTTMTAPVEYLAESETENSSEALLGNNPTGADDTVVAGYANYAAAVSNVSYGAISLTYCPNSLSVSDYSNYSALGITTDMMTASTQFSPSVSTPVYMYADGAWQSLNISDIAAGDVVIVTYASADAIGAGADPVWIVIASKSADGGTGANMSGGSSKGGSSSVSTSESSSADEPENTYTITEKTLMSIIPNNTMSVTMSVDELDVLSLEVGQQAVITLDAIKDETFSGTVTAIDLTGTNSGGSTKFTADVRLDRTENMLAGMNASVSIILSSTECDVTLPVASLMEDKSGAYVYKSYDENTETLGDPVYVTTGLSDGKNVQIASGVESDETVWYAYDDTVDISSSVVDSSSGSGFNIMSIFGGGRRR